VSALPATGEHQANLQANVSKVVELYMVMADIKHQKVLAERLGWSESMMTRKLRGKWTLEDLEILADVSGLQPSDFLRHPDELVALARRSWNAQLALVSPPLGQLCFDFEPVPPAPELALVSRGAA
jgi:hypothetical protein